MQHVMPSSSYSRHIQLQTRRFIAVSAGLLTAFVPVTAALAMPTTVGAAGEYTNASIADRALAYNGKWGGEACISSRKPGDSGGQCRSFVNCIVWMASGGTQNLGGRDYFRTFLAAGGQEIRSLDQLQKGDIVQEGHGRHTFIIVGRVAGSTFQVVDSNHRWNERVSTYNRNVTLNYSKRAFRMGLIGPGSAISPASASIGSSSTTYSSTRTATKAKVKVGGTAITAAPATPKPIVGNLESIEATEDGAIIRGWAIDGDVTRPVNTRIYANETGEKPEDGTSMVVKADISRMDIVAKQPGYGASHGLRTFMPLPVGSHTVCMYGLNASGTPGENTKLGCQAVIIEE